jgi:hypothetical protein
MNCPTAAVNTLPFQAAQLKSGVVGTCGKGPRWVHTDWADAGMGIPASKTNIASMRRIGFSVFGLRAQNITASAMFVSGLLASKH